jgi:hypothetical protein
VNEALARGLVALAGGYAAVGVVFAIPFAWRGAGVLEPVAAEGTLGFRLLILPGAATLWPYLLYRWVRARP